MARASQIAGRQEEATLDVGGISINLAFYPDRFSPHILRQFAGLLALRTLFSLSLDSYEGKQPEDIEADLLGQLSAIETKLLSKTSDVAEILCTLIAHWDLEEDEEACEPGSFVALAPSRLVKFGFVFLFRLLEALMGALHLMGEAKGVRQNGHLPASSGAKVRRKR